MNPVWIELGALLVGFALLAKGADALVDGGATLARRSGISPLVVGLTVVAWGTSLPEVVVSTLAAASGKPASSLGNVLGSNVANIGLVLGTSALILPSTLLGRARLREMLWLLGSIGALWYLCADRALARPEAGALLGAFVFYNVLLLTRGSRGIVAEAVQDAEEHRTKRPWTAVILGSAAIAIGAKFVIFGAEGLALRVGLPDRVIGLTIFALGTSLPELAAGVTSALKGEHEIGYGNVVGSNVFNTLAVTGIAALVEPFQGPAAEPEIAATLVSDFPVTLGFSVVLAALPFLFKNTAGRLPGGLLVTGYLSYIAFLLVRALV